MISIASCCVCKSIVQESGNSLMECNTCQNLYHQVSLIKNMFPSLAFLNSAFRCATILQSAMKKPKTPGWSGTVWNAQSELNTEWELHIISSSHMIPFQDQGSRGSWEIETPQNRKVWEKFLLCNVDQRQCWHCQVQHLVREVKGNMWYRGTLVVF